MRAVPRVLLLALAPFTGTHAQQQPIAPAGGHRSGGWFGIGMTVGTVSESYPIDGGTTITLNVRAGGTVSPRVRLGGEFDLGTVRSDLLASLALVGTIYPVARADLFLKVGMGARVFADLEYVYVPLDLIGIVGLGYDLRPRDGRISFTPFLQLALGPTVLSFVDPVRETFRRQFQFGFGVTWH